MKDIRKLKIWPELKEAGFQTKEFRSCKIAIGRGAILSSLTGHKIEIKPLLNGKWLIEVSSLTSSTEWTCNPFEMGEVLPKQIELFKNKIT